MEPESQAGKWTPGKVVLFLLVISPALLFGGGFIYEHLSHSPPTAEERAARRCTDDISALVMSQEFVRDRLRAPATAEFPYVTSRGVEVTYLGDCRHRVSAYVDAQNSLGGLLRRYYVAEVSFVSGNRWQLDDLSFH